jgi:hypothetical protein
VVCHFGSIESKGYGLRRSLMQKAKTINRNPELVAQSRWKSADGPS